MIVLNFQVITKSLDSFELKMLMDSVKVPSTMLIIELFPISSVILMYGELFGVDWRIISACLVDAILIIS